MTGQHCTTDGYGNTGCIGTAVHIHSGVLPYSGLDALFALYLAAVLVICGIVLRLRRAA